MCRGHKTGVELSSSTFVDSLSYYNVHFCGFQRRPDLGRRISRTIIPIGVEFEIFEVHCRG